MEIQSSNTKKIIIGVALSAVLAFAIYYFFFRSTAAPAIVYDQFGNQVQAQVVGQDLVDLLSQLKTVTLDQALFHSAAFLFLTDYGITLPNETPGRKNPFDLLPGVVQNTASAASAPSQKTR
jgi:hypothetical protein